MNDELRLQFSRGRLRGQLGFLSGRIVTDLVPIVVTHDPVVEIIVGNNVIAVVAIVRTPRGCAMIVGGTTMMP
jgi:hypothetical protein